MDIFMYAKNISSVENTRRFSVLHIGALYTVHDCVLHYHELYKEKWFEERNHNKLITSIITFERAHLSSSLSTPKHTCILNIARNQGLCGPPIR